MQKETQQEQLRAVGKTALDMLKTIEQNPKWQKTKDKPCIMYKMEIEGRIASRGQAVVSFPMEEVFQFLKKEDTLLKLNSQLLEWKTLFKNQDQSLLVSYMLYKGIWPVANRDLVSVGIFQVSETKCFIANRHCDYPYAQVKGVVRAQCYIGGYIIQKIDDTTTKVTYISDVDIKGSIPGMIKNTLSEKQGEVASRIQKTMKLELTKK